MATNQILSGQARMIRPGEMVLDPGPRSPINIDTRSSLAAVEADGNAFARADMGRAKIGEAVGDLGDNMSKLALAQMEAINITKRAEAQNAMSEGEAEMQAAMVKEPDELKWEGIATAYAAKTRERIDKMALSPVAKSAVDSDFSRWQIHRTGQAKIESAKQSIAKANGAISDRIKLASLTQDYGMWEEATNGAVERGMMTPEAKEISRVNFKNTGEELTAKAEAEQRKIDQDRLSVGLREDPWTVLEDLERSHPDNPTVSIAYPMLDPTARLNYIANAKEAIRRKQADEVAGPGGIQDRIVSSIMNPDEEEPITVQQITDGAAGLRLGAKDTQELLDFRTKLVMNKLSKAPLDRGAVAALIGEIEGYNGDPQSDPGAVKWGDMVRRAEMLTISDTKEGSLTRGVLMQKLYLRNPYAERSSDKDIPEGMEKQFNSYLSAYHKDDSFGVKKFISVPKLVGTKGGVAKSEDEFEVKENPLAAAKLIEHQSRLWNILKPLIKANPLQWQEPGAIEKWVDDQLKTVKTGASVDKHNAEQLAPTGLMPTGMNPFPGSEDLDAVIGNPYGKLPE